MKNFLYSLTAICAMMTVVDCKGAEAQMTDYGALETAVGEPVTMSATGTPQRAEDVAANITIITADQIRQSGSRDIPGILSRVPGLDILHEGIHSYDIGVRGYQQAMQPRLLVLIDGRQVFNDDYSRTIWENLPVNIDDIRQIEVVTGPTSALFGSNASGGVINIITYSPLFDKTNVGSITYGTQNSMIGDVTMSSKIGNSAGVKLSAGGVTGTEFNTPRSGGPNSESSITTDPEHDYLSLSSVFQLQPNLLTNLETTYSKSRDTESYYNGRLGGVEAETYSLRGGLSWETPFGTIKNNTYFNHQYVDNDEISTTLPRYNDTANTLVSQLEDQFKVGKNHTFRISGEYQSKQFHVSAPSSAPVDTTINEDNIALSGMWLWQITDKLALTNAVREDRLGLGLKGTLYSDDPYTNADFDRALYAFSANSGFVYKPTDKDVVSMTYGRGVQMPSLLDYGFNTINLSTASAVAVERDGNPYLNPTIVTNYEVDYAHALAEIHSTAGLSVFYQENSDIIAPFQLITTKVTGVSATTRDRQSINAGDSSGFGGELRLYGSNPAGYRWDLSYSYANIKDDAQVLQAFGYEQSAPMNHFRVLLGYTSGPWEFDTNMQYLTDRTLFRLNTARQQSDSYTSVSGRVGYKISDSLTLSLSGTDLTQETTQESAYPKVERQVFLSLTKRF